MEASIPTEQQRTARVLRVAPDPAPRPPRQPQWRSIALAALLVLFGLGIGVLVTLLLSGDDEVSPQVMLVSDPPLDADVLAGQVGEPVVAVAQAVGPTVVRIDAEGGIGSGIIIDSSGLVVTNAHVVGSQSDVLVQLSDGTRYTARVVGVDLAVDVALVRLPDGGPYPAAVFAPWSSVQAGQSAIAIGSPFGLEQTVTQGIVSSAGRVVDTSRVEGSTSLVEMIQTDASINPGNSGGALANRNGEVVGMNSSIRTDDTNASIGVGFALPTDTVLLAAQRILADQAPGNGYLGIQGSDPTTGPPGALVTSVVTGQGAEQAGLLAGDLVTSLDADDVASMAELAAKIRLVEPGRQVIIGYHRGGEHYRVIAQVGTAASE